MCQLKFNLYALRCHFNSVSSTRCISLEGYGSPSICYFREITKSHTGDEQSYHLVRDDTMMAACTSAFASRRKVLLYAEAHFSSRVTLRHVFQRQGETCHLVKPVYSYCAGRQDVCLGHANDLCMCQRQSTHSVLLTTVPWLCHVVR